MRKKEKLFVRLTLIVNVIKLFCSSSLTLRTNKLVCIYLAELLKPSPIFDDKEREQDTSLKKPLELPVILGLAEND